MAMARKEPKAKRKGGLPEFVTSIDLGAHLGVTSKRVQQLSQEGVLERLGRGKYEFSKAVQAYIAYKVAFAEKQNQSTSADRLRDRREQKEALRIAREERELIHIDESDAAMQEVCGALLDFVSSLPARITRDVRERQRIEAICDAGRLRLSDRFEKARRAVRDGGEADEASEEDAA